ncbi:MAG: SdiA-regulated domain-containing protein [Chitinivibrionales bacterium]
MMNILLRGVVLAALLLPLCRSVADEDELPFHSMERFEVSDLEEPSGVCFHPERNTLFVVDDEGSVGELRTDNCGIINHKAYSLDFKADFEGVALHPESDMLYIAVEGEEVVLEVDVETLEPERIFEIPRSFEGRTMMEESKRGLEAITFLPDEDHPDQGTFLVGNQSYKLDKKEGNLSVIFQVSLPFDSEKKRSRAEVLRNIMPGIVDVSGLSYDPERDVFFLISDAKDRLLVYSPSGERLGSWSLPGDGQEGIAFDSEGRLFIACDSGGLLRIDVKWEDLDL